MAIKPYIEAPTVREAVQSYGNPMDLGPIVHLRQGVSIKDNTIITLEGTLPRFTGGTKNHEIVEYNFGQSKDYAYDPVFDDLRQKFYPVPFIVFAEQFYPTTTAENFVDDGALEPLIIRDDVTNESIETPFISHAIRGSLGDGNEDYVKRTNVVQQFIEIELPSIVAPYEDVDDHYGNDISTAVILPGYVTDQIPVINPYNDATIDDSRLVTNSNSLDENGNTLSINQSILNMSPNKSDETLLRGHKSAGAGFTYDNNSLLGTDSIAFGGLDRTQ